MIKKYMLIPFLTLTLLLTIQLKVNAEVTPIKFCLWPVANEPYFFGIIDNSTDLGFPDIEKVYGLNIGLINYSEEVRGVDFGLLGTVTKNVYGVKGALISNGHNLVGSQLGIANLQNNVTGFQMGIYNQASELIKAFQLGLVNMAYTGNGLQIGGLNIMENGFLGIFPVFNFPADWIFPKDTIY
ncbi:MAG: hypothetical protein GY756_28250 [bacterium]|nr:hypothetical protein [bacterium]